MCALWVRSVGGVPVFRAHNVARQLLRSGGLAHIFLRVARACLSVFKTIGCDGRDRFFRGRKMFSPARVRRTCPTIDLFYLNSHPTRISKTKRHRQKNQSNAARSFHFETLRAARYFQRAANVREDDFESVLRRIRKRGFPCDFSRRSAAFHTNMFTYACARCG